jgi:hypothetical protein
MSALCEKTHNVILLTKTLDKSSVDFHCQEQRATATVAEPRSIVQCQIFENVVMLGYLSPHGGLSWLMDHPKVLLTQNNSPGTLQCIT